MLRRTWTRWTLVVRLVIVINVTVAAYQTTSSVTDVNGPTTTTVNVPDSTDKLLATNVTSETAVTISVHVDSGDLAMMDAELTNDTAARQSIWLIAPEWLSTIEARSNFPVSLLQSAVAKSTSTSTRPICSYYYKICENMLNNMCTLCTGNASAQTPATNNVNDILVIGSWCDMRNSLGRINAWTRAKHRNDANKKSNVVFLSVSPNLPLHQQKSSKPGHTAFTIALNGMRVRYAEALWEVLTVHFKWKHFVLVDVSSVPTRNETLEQPDALLFCSEVFDIVQSMNGKAGIGLDVEKFRFWFSDEGHTDKADESSLKEVVKSLSMVTRVVAVCGTTKALLAMIQHFAELAAKEPESVSDTRGKHQQYAVVALEETYDQAKVLIDKLATVPKGREFTKVLAPDDYSCDAAANVKLHTGSSSASAEGKKLAYGKRYACALADFIFDQGDNAPESLLKKLAAGRPYEKKSDRGEVFPSLGLYNSDLKKSVSVTWSNDARMSLTAGGAPDSWMDGVQDVEDIPAVCANRSAQFRCAVGRVGGGGSRTDGGYTQAILMGIVLFVIFAAFIGTIAFCLYIIKRHEKSRLLNTWVAAPARLKEKSSGGGGGGDTTSKAERLKRTGGVIGATVRFGKFKRQKFIAYDIPTKLDARKLRSPELMQELAKLGRFTMSNLVLVELLGFDDSNIEYFTLFYTYENGSLLTHIVRRVQLQDDLKYSLVRDLAFALDRINRSFLKVHGDLRTDRCIIDERFVLRVAITRLPKRDAAERKYIDKTGQSFCASGYSSSCYLWTAPELLKNPRQEPTPACDVYSFGVITHEIAYQMGPFYYEPIQQKHTKKSMSSSESRTIKDKIEKDIQSTPQDLSCAQQIVKKRQQLFITPTLTSKMKETQKLKMLEQLMVQCWCENPDERLKIGQVVEQLHEYTARQKIDVVYNVGKRLTEASKNVVTQLDKQSNDVLKERDLAFRYLTHFLPPNLCYEFLSGETKNFKPAFRSNVTIYFNDLTNFSDLITQKTLVDVISRLDKLFIAYDNLLSFYDIVPMHRVGSSLMLCSGVPHANAQHTAEIAQIALQIRQLVRSFTDVILHLRAGIHSGAVMSGLVGKHIPQFGVFGDTVNTASRMSSTGEVDKIQMSAPACTNLQAVSKHFLIQSAGEKQVKGLGLMKTFWLDGYDAYGEGGALPITGRLDKGPVPRRFSGLRRSMDEMTQVIDDVDDDQPKQPPAKSKKVIDSKKSKQIEDSKKSKQILEGKSERTNKNKSIRMIKQKKTEKSQALDKSKHLQASGCSKQ